MSESHFNSNWAELSRVLASNALNDPKGCDNICAPEEAKGRNRQSACKEGILETR